MAIEFSSHCIPLSAVGMVFNYTGNHLLHYIAQQMRRKIFFPNHTVNSVQLLNNGDILTYATRKDIDIVLKNNNGSNIQS